MYTTKENIKKYVEKSFDLWESTNDRIYIESSSKMYYPVFIISEYVSTPLAPIIKVVTKSDVNHSLISFDYKLKSMFSYGIRSIKNGKIGGFQVENIETNTSNYPDKNLIVNMIFIPEYKYYKLRSIIKSFFLNLRGSSYSLPHLIDFITKQEKSIDDESLVCSTFVNYCLEQVGIKLTNNPQNLVSPKDLSESYDNKKCFNVYKGTYKDYNPKKIYFFVKKLSQRINKPISYDTRSISESTIENMLKYNMEMFYGSSNDLYEESIKDGINKVADKAVKSAKPINDAVNKATNKVARTVIKKPKPGSDPSVYEKYENKITKVRVALKTTTIGVANVGVFAFPCPGSSTIFNAVVVAALKSSTDPNDKLVQDKLSNLKNKAVRLKEHVNAFFSKDKKFNSKMEMDKQFSALDSEAIVLSKQIDVINNEKHSKSVVTESMNERVITSVTRFVKNIDVHNYQFYEGVSNIISDADFSDIESSMICESLVHILLEDSNLESKKDDISIERLHITSDNDLQKWMQQNIQYKEFTRLMSAQDVLMLKKGSCHDQVVLECELLKQLGLSPHKLFFIEYNDESNVGGNTHTLVYYVRGNNFYWFENAWKTEKGIHGPYKNISELKKDIINIHNKENSTYDKLKFALCPNDIPEGITLDEYVKKCI